MKGFITALKRAAIYDWYLIFSYSVEHYWSTLISILWKSYESENIYGAMKFNKLHNSDKSLLSGVPVKSKEKLDLNFLKQVARHV